jgi:ribosomal protein S27AE
VVSKPAKESLIAALPDTQACPCCDSVMVKEDGSPDTYVCGNCGARVWADPIGCGLVRYSILKRGVSNETP